MRDYSKMGPRFWTGETGKWLRTQGRDHQVLGIYLFTCPLANMIGLYYLPMPTLIHEVGGIDTEGALKVLRSLSEGGYATFDERSETVFVVEMAKHQIGEHLTKRDNRHKAVVKELEQYRKSPFFNAFLDRYAAAFELEGMRRNAGNSKGLSRGSEAPSKPGTGAGAGEGSEAGAGTETESGAEGHAHLNGQGHGESQGAGEDFSGQSATPKEPSPKGRGPTALRRNGDFEAINDAVCGVLSNPSWNCNAGDTTYIAKLCGITEAQARESVRQLRDRGRLPAVAA